jgi:predicted HicB family RNase H-like nuclease
MKRVNIQLSAELHTKAKIIAMLKEETLNDYLASLVNEGVGRDKRFLEKVPK